MASATPRTGTDTLWKRNLAFIWIGVFVGLLGANFVFPFIPTYVKELGVSGESDIAFYTSLTASATGLSLTLTAPIWGSLADRYGRKPMFLRALIGAGVLVGVVGVAQAVWQLGALRFLMGDIRTVIRFFKNRCDVRNDVEIFNAVTGLNAAEP